MSCTWTINGKEYTQQEYEDYTRSNPHIIAGMYNKLELQEYEEFLDTLLLTDKEKKFALDVFKDQQDTTGIFNMQPATNINLGNDFNSYLEYKKQLLSKLENSYQRFKDSNRHNFNTPSYKDKNNQYFNLIKDLENDISGLNISDANNVFESVVKEIEYLSNLVNNMKDNYIASEDLEARINFLTNKVLGYNLDRSPYLGDIWDGSDYSNYNDVVKSPVNKLMLDLIEYRNQRVNQLIEESPAYNRLQENMSKGEFEKVLKDTFFDKMRDISVFEKGFLGLNSNDDTGFTTLAFELYQKNIEKNKSVGRDKIKDLLKFGDVLNDTGFDLSNFLAKDNEGINTGNIIHKYTEDYTVKSLNKLYELRKTFRDESDYNASAKSQAYRNLVSWYKVNTEIIDFRKLQYFKDLYGSHPEYSKYFSFSESDMKTYEDNLRANLGKLYEDTIQSLESKLSDFENAHASKKINSPDWVNRFVAESSPFEFIQNFEQNPFSPIGFEAKGKGYTRYNNSTYIEFIPKKDKVNIDTGEVVPTGFYEDSFNEIENNENAFQYWKILRDLYQTYINPTYIEAGQDINSLSYGKIEKSLAEEIIKNPMKTPGVIFDTWKKMFFDDSNVREDDKITSNYYDKSNMEIYTYKNTLLKYGVNELNEIAKKSGINTMSESDITTGIVDSKTKTDALKQYKRELADKIARKKVYASKSTELTKVTHALFELATLQRARQDSTTIMELLYNQHMNITNPDSSMRNKSNEKFRNWIDTNIYNKRIGEENRTLPLGKYLEQHEKDLKDLLVNLKNKLDSNDNLTFTVGEEDYIRDTGVYLKLDENGNRIAITKDQFEDGVAAYIDNEIAKLGKDSTIEGVMNGFIHNLVLKAFVVSPISGMFNRAEGLFTNMINDASGRFWTRGNWSNSKRFMALSNLIKFGGDKVSALNKGKYLQLQTFQNLLDELGIIQDRKNEVEKRDKESTYRKWTSRLNPFAFAVDNPERKNQGEVILSVLQDVYITDNKGDKYQFFDSDTLTFNAYKPGTTELRDEFKYNADGSINQDNIGWETFNYNEDKIDSNQYFLTKQNLVNTISQIQGNYSNTDSIQFTQNKGWLGVRWGKVLMLFMRWFPEHVNQRFGSRKLDVISGKTNQLGRFRGLMRNAPSASIAMGIMSTLTLGPLAGLILGGLPITIMGGKMLIDKVFLNKAIDTQIMSLKTMTSFMQDILTKTLSFYPKMAYSRKAGKFIDSKLGAKYNNLTDAEAGAMSSMATDLAVQINVLLVMILLKSLLHGGAGDDDEDNMLHNFIDNQGNRIISGLSIWSNPKQLIEDNSKFALVRTLGDVMKFAKNCQKLFTGDKVDKEGMAQSFIKTQPIIPIPNIITNAMTRGQYPGMDPKEYQNSQWFDRYTKPQSWRDEREFKAERSRLKELYKEQLMEDMENSELSDKEIEEEVTKKLRKKMRDKSISKGKKENYEQALDRVDFEEAASKIEE